ncbi:MAG: hypothetical protein AB7I33_15785 [Gemmatimonadales bacterium]
MRVLRCCLIFWLLHLPATGAHGQVLACSSDTMMRANLLTYLQDVAAGSDSVSAAWRSKLSIPVLSVGDVQSVATDSMCMAAADAVSREIGIVPPQGRAVVLIRLGGEAWAVWDSTLRAGHFSEFLVFDAAFQRLKARVAF